MNKEIPAVSTKRAILGYCGTGSAASRDGAFITDFVIEYKKRCSRVMRK